MSRNRFVDPASGIAYNWTINHTEESEQGKTRNITRTASTAGVGIIRQQGDDGQLILKLSGTILHREQFRGFWQWYQLCRTQTIYFYDFDDQGYEVQITSFLYARKRTLRNPRDPSAPYHYWTYTMEMEVYNVLGGDLGYAGVTP